MGRGEKKKQLELTTGAYNNANAWVNQQRGSTTAEDTALTGGINEFGSTGYSPEEQAAIEGGAVEAGNASFDAAGANMRRRAATSGSRSGLYANTAELAREKARTGSDIVRGTKQTFADEKSRRKQAALQMLQQKYGINTNLLGNISGLPLEALNSRQRAANMPGTPWREIFGAGASIASKFI